MENKIDSLEKTPLIDLVEELDRLEKEMNLNVLRYNRICLEIHRRIPNTKDDAEFKPKEFKSK